VQVFKNKVARKILGTEERRGEEIRGLGAEIKGEKVFERKRSDSRNEIRKKKTTEYGGGGGRWSNGKEKTETYKRKGR
jgi:hypothetical protein